MMRLPSLRWLLTMLCGMVGLSIIMWVWLSVTYVEHVFIQDTAGAEPDGIVINVGKINAPVPLGAASVLGTSVMVGLVVYKVRESRPWWWVVGAGASVAMFFGMVAIHIAILLYLGSAVMANLPASTGWRWRWRITISCR